MNSWVDILEDPHSIRAIYGSDVPSLTTVQLHEVCLHRDGPSITLRFDLPEFPAAPPQKWLEAVCNTVQVKLMLIDVQNVSLHGLNHKAVVDLSLTKKNNLIELSSSGATKMEIQAKWAQITDISAYRDDN